MTADTPATHYPALLADIKQRIRQAQTRAVLAATPLKPGKISLPKSNCWIV